MTEPDRLVFEAITDALASLEILMALRPASNIQPMSAKERAWSEHELGPDFEAEEAATIGAAFETLRDAVDELRTRFPKR